MPNATVAAWGNAVGEARMRSEIFARGPIACGLDSGPLHTYTGGVFDDGARSDKVPLLHPPSSPLHPPLIDLSPAAPRVPLPAEDH